MMKTKKIEYAITKGYELVEGIIMIYYPISIEFGHTYFLEMMDSQYWWENLEMNTIVVLMKWWYEEQLKTLVHIHYAIGENDNVATGGVVETPVSLKDRVKFSFSVQNTDSETSYKKDKKGEFVLDTDGQKIPLGDMGGHFVLLYFHLERNHIIFYNTESSENICGKVLLACKMYLNFSS